MPGPEGLKAVGRPSSGGGWASGEAEPGAPLGPLCGDGWEID